MATGGVPDDVYSFELFECSVCMDSLMDKEPRLLQCGHTFCTPCLERLVNWNSISCPKCRAKTKLPIGGLKSIPKNTDLAKMKEWEIKLLQSNESKCQSCSGNLKAEYVCTDCKKFICKSCFYLHNEVPALKKHTVLLTKKGNIQQDTEICQKHEEYIEFFCLDCEDSLCVICISEPIHATHRHKILDYNKGIKTFKYRLNELSATLTDISDSTNICNEVVNQDLKKVTKVKENINIICENLEEKLRQMRIKKETVTNLEAWIKHLSKLIDNIQHQSRLMSNAKQKKIDREKAEGMEFVILSKRWQVRVKKVISDARKVMLQTYKIPEYLPGNLSLEGSLGELKLSEKSMNDILITQKENPVNTTENDDVDWKKTFLELGLEKPKEMLTVSAGKVEMECPKELVNVGDGSVILVDAGLNNVQRINTDGKVVRRYYLDDGFMVQSASIYDKHIYIASTEDTITKMALNGSGSAVVYKPSRVTVFYITAVRYNLILISEYTGTGRILEYNMETELVTQKVADIPWPSKVCVSSDHSTRYIVSYFHNYDVPARTKRIHIYNDEWNVIASIDMKDARGLAVTPGGKLLIADYKRDRILEYTLEGHFTKELKIDTSLMRKLLGQEIRRPCDIAYSTPYIWLLQGTSRSGVIYKAPCLKIFLVDEECMRLSYSSS